MPFRFLGQDEAGSARGPPATLDGVDALDLLLLRSQPARDRRIARQVDPLLDGHDGRQRHLERSPSRRRRLAPGGDRAVADLETLDARHASAARAPRRPGCRPGSRRCRPTRCRTGSGRTGRRPPPGPGSPRRSRPPSRPGPSRGRPSRAGSPARCRSPSRRGAAPRPRPGPSVRTADRAALRLDDPDGLLDRALLVRADREAEEPRVDVAAVGGQRRSGRRSPARA